MRPLPLKGVRIIAVEQYGAGPFGTQHLADLGAEVIKIENFKAGGDVSRQVGPHYLSPTDSLFFQAFNRNKQSICIDLKQSGSKEILHKLVAKSDVVFNNLRGDLAGPFGLDYASLGPIKPDIVCAHLSAYGREGSRASWPGYDYLMQAEAGYLNLTGEPEGPPARMGLSVIDLMTGTTAAMAILAGILEARSTGIGRDYDVSLFDVALHNLAYIATWYLQENVETSRLPRSAHPSLVPSQLYRTKDGWIFIMCNKEKFWQNLVALVDAPELTGNSEFETFDTRLKNRDALGQILDAHFSTKDTQEWIALFAGKVPCAPVLGVRGALENPFVEERNGIMEYEHPRGEPVRGIASPVRFTQSVPPVSAAPALGEHTDAVLQELGYGSAEISNLRNDGVVA